MPDPDPASLNRTRLFEALGAVLRRAGRTQKSAGLLMVSVTAADDAKTQPGVAAEDALVAETGRLLKACLKSADTIGRYGSNTFAILIDDCGPESLEGVADALIAKVNGMPLSTPAGPMAAALSVGGVVMPLHAPSVGEAIRSALAAVELAKQQAAGTFVAHTPEAAARRSLLREEVVSASVIGAIEEQRLLLMLQPIVRAGDHALAFYEALLRLRRNDGVTLPASDFIEDAEKLGLARQVDMRALELALPLLRKHRNLILSINISSLTAGDEDWIATLQSFSKNEPDIPRRLIVEMTETAMVHDFDAAAVFFERLRGLGCRIAIDDFGAGFTSFRHLRALTVDMLKIDGSFVVGARDDEHARVLVRSMIEMAKGLGLETVAEWVGDAETAAFVEGAGATYCQGFLYGQPMTIEDLEQKGAL